MPQTHPVIHLAHHLLHHFFRKMTTFDESRQMIEYVVNPLKWALTAYYEPNRNASSTVKK